MASPPKYADWEDEDTGGELRRAMELLLADLVTYVRPFVTFEEGHVQHTTRAEEGGRVEEPLTKVAVSPAEIARLFPALVAALKRAERAQHAGEAMHGAHNTRAWFTIACAMIACRAGAPAAARARFVGVIQGCERDVGSPVSVTMTYAAAVQHLAALRDKARYRVEPPASGGDVPATAGVYALREAAGVAPTATSCDCAVPGPRALEEDFEPVAVPGASITHLWVYRIEKRLFGGTADAAAYDHRRDLSNQLHEHLFEKAPRERHVAVVTYPYDEWVGAMGSRQSTHELTEHVKGFATADAQSALLADMQKGGAYRDAPLRVVYIARDARARALSRYGAEDAVLAGFFPPGCVAADRVNALWVPGCARVKTKTAARLPAAGGDCLPLPFLVYCNDVDAKGPRDRTAAHGTCGPLVALPPHGVVMESGHLLRVTARGAAPAAAVTAAAGAGAASPVVPAGTPRHLWDVLKDTLAVGSGSCNYVRRRPIGVLRFDTGIAAGAGASDRPWHAAGSTVEVALQDQWKKDAEEFEPVIEELRARFFGRSMVMVTAGDAGDGDGDGFLLALLFRKTPGAAATSGEINDYDVIVPSALLREETLATNDHFFARHVPAWHVTKAPVFEKAMAGHDWARAHGAPPRVRVVFGRYGLPETCMMYDAVDRLALFILGETKVTADTPLDVGYSSFLHPKLTLKDVHHKGGNLRMGNADQYRSADYKANRHHEHAHDLNKSAPASSDAKDVADLLGSLETELPMLQCDGGIEVVYARWGGPEGAAGVTILDCREHKEVFGYKKAKNTDKLNKWEKQGADQRQKLTGRLEETGAEVAFTQTMLPAGQMPFVALPQLQTLRAALLRCTTGWSGVQLVERPDSGRHVWKALDGVAA